MTYTPKKLAKHWDCSYKSILMLINEGLLQAFKIGTEWRIPEEQVKKYEGGTNGIKSN